MTSVYDIPHQDIEKFVLANNENFQNKDEAYDKATILLKDKKSIGHTTSIIEWMIAHNLFINKVDIPNYTIYEIDNMSQDEINELAKLLTMKGRNRENIKNILRYLHKLDEVVVVKQNIALPKKILLPYKLKMTGNVDTLSPEIKQRDKEIILWKLEKFPEDLLDITNYDYYFDENNSDIWKNTNKSRSQTARRKPKTLRSGSGVTMKKLTYGIRPKSIYEATSDIYDTIPGYDRLIVKKDNPEAYHRFNIIMNSDQNLRELEIGNIEPEVIEKKDIVINKDVLDEDISNKDISNKNVLDEIKVLPPSNTPYVYRFTLPQSYKKLSIKDLIKIMKFLNLQDSDFAGSGKGSNLLRQDRIDIINNFESDYGGNVIHINKPILNDGRYGFHYTDL